MGLTYEQQVQERIAGALERIEALLREQGKPEQKPMEQPKRRGRPPKVRNAEDDGK